MREEGRRRFPADFICRPASPERFQAAISQTDPAWVGRLPEEISVGDSQAPL